MSRDFSKVCKIVKNRKSLQESCYYVRKASDIQYDVYFSVNSTPSSIDRKVAEFDSKALADKFCTQKNRINLDIIMGMQF